MRLVAKTATGLIAAAALLNIGISKVYAAQVPSVIARYDIEESTTIAETNLNVTDLLRSKGSSILKPFEKLMDKLSRTDKNPCELETEFRFVTVTRSFEDEAIGDNAISTKLQAIKSLYGIRKAACETSASGVIVPSPCRILLPATSNIPKKIMIQSEIELASSITMSTCLRRYQEQHFLWTSYSNNLQEASGIVDLIRADIEFRSILAEMRDVAKFMIEFQNELEFMRKTTTSWFGKAGQSAQDFFNKQHTIFENVGQEFDNLTSKALKNMHSIQSAFESVQSSRIALESLLKNATSDLSSISRELSSIDVGVARMKRSMAEIYRDSILEVTSLTRSQMTTFDDHFGSLMQKFHDLAGSLQEMQAAFPNISQFTEHLNDLHLHHSARLEEQYELSGRVLEKQQAAIVLLEYLHGVIDEVSAGTETLSAAFSTATYLINFVQTHEHILVAVCIYIAICLMLAPFSGVLIHRKTVSDVKTGYWAFQAFIFLIRKLDLLNKFNSLKWILDAVLKVPVFVWLIGILVSGTTLVVLSFCSKPDGMIAAPIDVEMAQPGRKSRDNAYISDRQRRRMESICRNARHGTAPPGL